MTRLRALLVPVSLGLLAAAAAGETPVFAKLEAAKQIYGSETTIEDLRGRVVLLQYWGVNCGLCRALMPTLVRENAKHAPSGKFVLLASHVQQSSDEVRQFLRESRACFPVFQDFHEPAAPCPGGLPFAALIDHTGAVVAQGAPEQLLPKIAELIAAAPKPPAPIHGAVEIKHCRPEAKALASGNAVAPTLKTLDSAADKTGARAEEASALAAAARAYLERTKTGLETLAGTRPAAALQRLPGILKMVRGLPEEAPLMALEARLAGDREVKALAALVGEGARAREALCADPRGAETTAKIEKLRKGLAKFLKTEGLSETLRAEAEEMLELAGGAPTGAKP